ncbi:SCO2322 family protein [Streptomyces sp. NBC_00989]|uniref:SCO2322 family protein n=1 Tax=Streptomyces sp. NBC_00989 TaxID=2903705 RepID=UPI0038707CA8|nr:SCO2322 family protein [Streptomyces sp. NBC_00989]
MTRRRLLLLLTALLLALTANGPAQAAGYRYWSFWDRTGTHWTYATQGPSTARPDDGAVQGFRFAVSADSADAAQPRFPAADFATICANSPAADGKKRIALVIDFGTPTDAPSGETPPTRRTACATVAPDATTAEALATVAKPLRYDTNALLCAIAGYPQRGCGERITGQKQQKTATPHHGPSVGLLAGAAAIALLGAAAIWQARRRRHG